MVWPRNWQHLSNVASNKRKRCGKESTLGRLCALSKPRKCCMATAWSETIDANCLTNVMQWCNIKYITCRWCHISAGSWVLVSHFAYVLSIGVPYLLGTVIVKHRSCALSGSVVLAMWHHVATSPLQRSAAHTRCTAALLYNYQYSVYSVL